VIDCRFVIVHNRRLPERRDGDSDDKTMYRTYVRDRPSVVHWFMSLNNS